MVTKEEIATIPHESIRNLLRTLPLELKSTLESVTINFRIGLKEHVDETPSTSFSRHLDGTKTVSIEMTFKECP